MGKLKLFFPISASMVFTLPWNENSFTVNGQSSVIIYPQH